MPDPSPRVRYWREQRRRGVPLFAAACASPAEAAACLPLAPDLILFHPAFASAGAAGESGMLVGLAPLHNANDEAPEEFAALLFDVVNVGDQVIVWDGVNPRQA